MHKLRSVDLDMGYEMVFNEPWTESHGAALAAFEDALGDAIAAAQAAGLTERSIWQLIENCAGNLGGRDTRMRGEVRILPETTAGWHLVRYDEDGLPAILFTSKLHDEVARMKWQIQGKTDNVRTDPPHRQS